MAVNGGRGQSSPSPLCSGGIVLCINKNGQKNGQATVVFEDEEQVAMAMKRHEHHLKNHGRYLQVHSHVTCHVMSCDLCIAPFFCS